MTIFAENAMVDILQDPKFEGKKAKRATLKTEVTRKQNTSNFPKHFLPPDKC